MACLTACLFFSCGKKKAHDSIGDGGRTERTENLLAHLTSITDKGYLFGHQDATISAEGMSKDCTHSDVETVCGDQPALIGFELGGIETDDSLNIHSTPFRLIRREIIAHYDRGGVITISWQCKNMGSIADILEDGSKHEVFLEWLDKVAGFLNSLETPYGVKVPVIFRPWQENGEGKYAWCASACTSEQYKSLWQMTRERMEKAGVTNVLYAYSQVASPNASEAKYLARYPGDELVDVLGINDYCHAEEGDIAALSAFTQTLGENLKMLTEVGKKHGKPIALTETGYRSIRYDQWWTHCLSKAIASYPISYVMLWRNDHQKANEYYVPFPGKPTEDFVTFYNEPKTLFLHDVNGLYLESRK